MCHRPVDCDLNKLFSHLIICRHAVTYRSLNLMEYFENEISFPFDLNAKFNGYV